MRLLKSFRVPRRNSLCGFHIIIKGSGTRRFPLCFKFQMVKQTQRRFWRYGPLVLWIIFISFASTNQFSAGNTSAILRPILLWFFPNLSESRLAAVHFLTRKAGHFTEYAVLAFLARRAFITSSYAFLKRIGFN